MLADGKNALFLFLPDGEDPDDFVRKRGKAAFEALFERATPLSEFLIAELSSQHPPTSAEGRAALVHAVRPHVAQLASAPVLAALLRRRLAELTGLPETELRGLLRGAGGAAATGRRYPVGPGRRSRPSAGAQAAAGALARPRTDPGTAAPTRDGAREWRCRSPTTGRRTERRLAALARFCAAGEHPLTTAGVMQHFAGSPHEQLLTDVLVAAEDHASRPSRLRNT